MNLSTAKVSFFLLAIAGAFAALLTYAAPEDIAAFTVALFCGAMGFSGLMILRNREERGVILKLFAAAYLLRLVVILVFYKTGLSDMLGGGDDVIWKQAWYQSLYWVHGLSNPYMADNFIRAQTANSALSLYDGTVIHNTGYRFIATSFFYIINTPSQMALAVLNGFLNALTVVLIYHFSREFFSRPASLFAAIVALLLPGYLVWSALTVKETWLILAEITVMFAVWRLSRQRRWIYIPLILFIVLLVEALRYYVAWLLIPVIILSYFCVRSQRPWRTMFILVGAGLAFSLLLNQLGLAQLNIVSVGQTALRAMVDLRESIAAPKETGRASSIQLDYDVTSPQGFVLMFLTGSGYLLFAPFPWQIFTDASARQLLVLPESLLWYTLIFAFVLPGIIECAKRQKQLLVGIFLFIMPLILLYSLSFANIGLVYRQRAQLMPFFLLLVAAGYESRSRKRRYVQARRAVGPHYTPYRYAASYASGTAGGSSSSAKSGTPPWRSPRGSRA